MDMFHGECDYAFATWLHRSRFTMGDITSFFNDPRLRPLHENLSYKSAKKWKDSLSSIPFGLQDDEWRIEDIGITSAIPGLLEGVHYMFYQNVVGLIAFILSHRPFASEMAYAPVRTFNDDFDEPERMYHELHSADWWWETQAQLPPGATVIPVIVSVDKTQLSMHQGDVAAWPVYLSIGNLTRSARRRRNTPGTVLAGFIPIVGDDSDGNYTKRRAYHYAMGRIFERMYDIERWTTVR